MIFPTATSKMAGLPMAMNHPELGCPAVADIVAKWIEHGRYVGYELQFPGEKSTRHLRFKEIWQLQGYGETDEAAEEAATK